VRRARDGERPALPAAMDAAARRIIKQGWSVDPELRGSFDGIFDTLRRISFRLTPAVDPDRVAQSLALIEGPAPVTPPNGPRSPRHIEPRPAAGDCCEGQKALPAAAPPEDRRAVRPRGPRRQIAHLTRECGGKVDERGVMAVTSSKCWDDHPRRAARNVMNLEDCSEFLSAYSDKADDIPDTRNNWACFDFEERRIMPTHYTIQTTQYGPHLRYWDVKTSADADNWQEVDHRKDSGWWLSRTFAVVARAPARFIRLVQIGCSHRCDDRLVIETWEIFRSLVE
jgi:hypothetical protein